MRDQYAQVNLDPRRQVALQRAKRIADSVRPRGHDRFDPDQAVRGRSRVKIAIVVMLAMVIGLSWSLGMMLGFW